MGHYVVFVTLVYAGSTAPVFASSTGFIIGAVINYFLNHIYTFRSNIKHKEGLHKFFTVGLIGLLLNTLIMSLLTGLLSVHYFVSQVAATGIVLLWNFEINRIWTFKDCR